MQFDPPTQDGVAWPAVVTAFFTAIVALIAVINSWGRIKEVGSLGRSAIVGASHHARRTIARFSGDLRRRLWDYTNPHGEVTPCTGGMAEEWARGAAEKGDDLLREPWNHLGLGRYVGGSALSDGGNVAHPGLTFWWPDGSRATVFWRAGNYLLEVNQPTSESAWDWRPDSGTDKQWWTENTLSRWVDRIDLDRATSTLPYECTLAVEVARDGTGGFTYRLMLSIRHDAGQRSLSAEWS